MNCCVECFKDIHIRNTIEKQGTIGDCDFCSSKGVSIYDVAVIPNPIADMIVSLVQIYSVSDVREAKLLKISLHNDWDIFSAGTEMIQTIITKLCDSAYPANSEIFSKKVIIPQLTDEDFLREFGVVRGLSWSKFADSIKNENRFHNGMFNADAFASFLSIVAKNFTAETKFFRARIASNNAGFPVTEMGTPPSGYRSAGRVNPDGIGILYLSSDDKTVLNEVRANTFDYVTIGEFKATRDIKVVNLSGISSTSPFLYEGELEKYAANRKVFQEIATELAKPLRRSDDPLEYLPTQYIAEFIKSQGYDGVEYASTLREGGYNLAVFDEKLFECVNVNTVEVMKIQYETSKDKS
jgi:hypothetical protein